MSRRLDVNSVFISMAIAKNLGFLQRKKIIFRDPKIILMLMDFQNLAIFFRDSHFSHFSVLCYELH